MTVTDADAASSKIASTTKGKNNRSKEQERLHKQRQRRRRREEREELARMASGTSAQSRTAGTKRRIVLNFLSFFHRQTKALSSASKKEVLLDFLRDKTLEDVIGEEMRDLQAKNLIIQNIRDTMQYVKLSNSNDSLAAKRSCLAMSVTSEKSANVSDRKRGKVLGVHPRNFTLAKKKREEIGSQTAGKWVHYVRARRFDAINELVVQTVHDFWSQNTRISPNVKDVRSRRLEQGVREIHAAHYLEDTQVHIFLQSV